MAGLVALVAYSIHGRAILHLEFTAIRCGVITYYFLRRLRLENGVRMIYRDGGPWAASQAKLRL